MNKETSKTVKMLVKTINEESKEIAKDEGWKKVPLITETKLIEIALEQGLHDIEVGNLQVYYDPHNKDWFTD